MAALRWGPFPTGPIRLSASFDWYWRGGQRNQPDWPDIPAMSVRCPTNPSGNVLTQNEFDSLHALCAADLTTSSP